jgi:ATP-dependent DNA ligase
MAFFAHGVEPESNGGRLIDGVSFAENPETHLDLVSREVPLSNTENILFKDLCSTLNDVERIHGENPAWSNVEKLKYIFSESLVRIVAGHSTYPLVRLLSPYHDGRKYLLQESTLIKLYISVLSLDGTPAAGELSKWQQSKVDLCDSIESILCPRCSVSSSQHTLKDVNELLDRLSGKGCDKKELFTNEIVPKFSANEQKWLIRIILGSSQDIGVKIGIKLDSILNQLDSNAKKTFDYYSDLRITCAMATPAGKRFLAANHHDALALKPFAVFNPMLSRRSNTSIKHSALSMVDAAEAQMNDLPFVMETKIDGERMIFHLEGDRVLLHSRKGNDYTDKYSTIVNTIKAVVMRAGISGCILDGEVVAWDTVHQRALPFGQNRRVGKIEGRSQVPKNEGSDDDEEEYTSASFASDVADCSNFITRFFVFDCLYLTGKPALNILRSSIQEAINSGQLPNVDRHENYHCIKDIQYQNSAPGPLLDLPLAVRRNVAKHLLSTRTDAETVRICTVIEKVVLSSDVSVRKEELKTFFEARNAAGEEGLLIKRLDGCYILNNRTKTTWLKLKPEYSETFSDMDLLVIGGYYGTGKNTGMLSSFAVAVRSDEADEFGNIMYWPCGKVGSGFSKDEMNSINEHFSKRIGDKTIHPWSKDGLQPDESKSWLVNWNAKGDTRPDFLLPPDESCIVFTTKCTELVVSSEFPTLSVPRFPRVTRIRMDKRPEDVMTRSEWKMRLEAPRDKLSHDALTTTGSKKRKATTEVSKVDPRHLGFKTLNPDASVEDENGTGYFSTEGVFHSLSFHVIEDSFPRDYAEVRTNPPNIGKKKPEPMQVKVELPLCYMVDYTAKSVAVFGETSQIYSVLRQQNGSPNQRLRNPITNAVEMGFIWPLEKKESVLKATGIPFVESQGSYIVEHSPLEASDTTEKPAKYYSNSFKGIRSLILRNNGNIAESYSAGLNPLVIVGRVRPFSIPTKNLITNQNCCVVSHEYILACVRARQHLPISSDYYIAVSTSVYSTIRADFDLWGASLTAEVSPISTELIIENALLRAERYSNQVNAVSSKRGKELIVAKNALGTVDEMHKNGIRNDWKSTASMIRSYKGNEDELWRALMKGLEPRVREELRRETEMALWSPDVVIYFDILPVDCERPATFPYSFDSNRVPGSDGVEDTAELLTLATRFRARGACVSSSLNKDITHIVSSMGEQRQQTLLEKLQSLGNSKPISFRSQLWARECLVYNVWKL